MRDVIVVSLVFFKQKTAYEMRISVWSSDVCSSDLELVFSAMAKIKPVPVTAPGKWKVGVLRGFFSEKSSPDMAASFEAALGKLSAAGMELVERSEERRVGKECVSTCRARVSPDN